MPEIGIERLSTRDSEEDSPQRHEADQPVVHQEVHGMKRVETHQHPGMIEDVIKARHGEAQEPEQRDGAEEGRHPCRSLRLHEEQRDDDRKRNGHHIGLEGRCDDLEALDRREHRDRRRDDGIAIEQCCPDHAQHREPCDRLAHGALRQRHQRECAALPLIVGIEQDQHVFDGNDENQRPQDEREHAQHHGLAHSAIGAHGRRHRFAEGIERAGADVAVDDADRANGEHHEAWPADAVA